MGAWGRCCDQEVRLDRFPFHWGASLSIWLEIRLPRKLPSTCWVQHAHAPSLHIDIRNHRIALCPGIQRACRLLVGRHSSGQGWPDPVQKLFAASTLFVVGWMMRLDSTTQALTGWPADRGRACGTGTCTSDCPGLKPPANARPHSPCACLRVRNGKLVLLLRGCSSA